MRERAATGRSPLSALLLGNGLRHAFFVISQSLHLSDPSAQVNVSRGHVSVPFVRRVCTHPARGSDGRGDRSDRDQGYHVGHPLVCTGNHAGCWRSARLFLRKNHESVTNRRGRSGSGRTAGRSGRGASGKRAEASPSRAVAPHGRTTRRLADEVNALLIRLP